MLKRAYFTTSANKQTNESPPTSRVEPRQPRIYDRLREFKPQREFTRIGVAVEREESCKYSKDKDKLNSCTRLNTAGVENARMVACTSLVCDTLKTMVSWQWARHPSRRPRGASSPCPSPPAAARARGVEIARSDGGMSPGQISRALGAPTSSAQMCSQVAPRAEKARRTCGAPAPPRASPNYFLLLAVAAYLL